MKRRSLCHTRSSTHSLRVLGRYSNDSKQGTLPVAHFDLLILPLKITCTVKHITGINIINVLYGLNMIFNVSKCYHFMINS